jgi:hypothetical protein
VLGTLRTDTQGYVWEKVGHRDGATSNGWIQRHRLVVEEHIGRALLDGENVHHRNGRKDDNRIENLELWVTRQPKGQRVTDLVQWAREILDRYETIAEMQTFA